MSWPEAIMLTRELLKDPATRLSAAIARWEYPLSREAFLLADLHDRFTQVNFKTPKPYPRPTDRNVGRSAQPTVSQGTIRAALAARGHGVN